MLPRIVTFAALIGMAMGAATPSNFARDFKLLQAQQAAEAPKLAESGIVLLHTEPTSNRSFIEIYGSINNSTSPIASRSKSIVRVPGMCGEEKIDCSYDNGPPEDVTKQLIDILYAQTEWTPLASHPSYCLYGNGSRACVSWNKDIGTFALAYLAPAAEATYNECGAGRSGRSYNVRLGFHCVTQCLSNLPYGC